MLGINPVGSLSISGLDDLEPPRMGDLLTMLMDAELEIQFDIAAEPRFTVTMENDVEDVEE